MVRDPPPGSTATGDASPDRSPDELPLADERPDPQPNTTRGKHKRSSQSQTELRPVKKPLFATPAPVASAASAPVQGTVTTAAGTVPGSAQALSSTSQPNPFDSLPPGNTNPKSNGARQDDSLAQAVGHLAQSMKDHPKLYVPAGASPAPSAAVLPLTGTNKQVHPISSAASVSVTGPPSRPMPFNPSKSASHDSAANIQGLQARHAPPVNHNQKQKSGLGTGCLLPTSLIAPKPLLNAPTPVPPRPPMHSIALRPTLPAAQLASTLLARAATPPSTDAATPHQQECRDSMPQRRNSSSVKPQVSAANTAAASTAAASTGQGSSHLGAVHGSVHPGHKHISPVYMPKTQPQEQPKSESKPDMLARVYERCDNSARSHPRVRNQVATTGGVSRPELQQQLSIDVLVPPGGSTAAAPPPAASVPSAPNSLPAHAPATATDLAHAARALQRLKGAAAASPAIAAMHALDFRFPPAFCNATSTGAAAAAVASAQRTTSAPQLPAAGATAAALAAVAVLVRASSASQPLVRWGSGPVHAGAAVNPIQPCGPAPPGNVVLPGQHRGVQRPSGHIAVPVRADPRSQAQLATPLVRPGTGAMPSPRTGAPQSRGHNPAAAIAAAATATVGKRVHPKLNFGSSGTAPKIADVSPESLASLVKQLNERPPGAVPSAVAVNAAGSHHSTSKGPVHTVPTVPSGAARDPRRKPSCKSQGVDAAAAAAASILPQQLVAKPSAKRSVAAAHIRVNAGAVEEPAAAEANSSTTLTPSAVTLQHLLDTGLIAAGVDVLQCTKGEKSGQLATLNADGTVQVKDAAACALADLVRLRNGKSVAQVSEEEVWHCVTYDTHPLQHYRQQYIASLGAAPDLPPRPKASTASPQTPFVWRFFEDLARQQQKHPEAHADPDTDMTGQRDEGDEGDDDEEVVIVPSPARKRSRRQVTTIVSYAKLATEGVQEGDGSKGSGRNSRQGSKSSTEHSIVPFSVEDVETRVQYEMCKPLDVTLLQGVARFAHLQPPPPAPTAPLASIPSSSKPLDPALKRAPSAAKPLAQSTAHQNNHVCPAAAAAALAAAAGVGQLQPLDKMSKLPPMPRKLKSFNSALPNAPKSAPSTTASCAPQVDAAQRSRRAPTRTHGVSGLTHAMMQLEAYTRAAGEPGADAQPFSVDVHPLVLAAMDIHAHLCQNEIIGVLGGRYDAQQGRLVVLKCLSVQEGVLDVGKTDVEMDPADQSRAIEELQQEGLQCVGWYHSHPTFPVWPSAIDVYNQQIQQVARSHEAANGGSTPYIAAIVGPYDQKNASSQCAMSWFYVENKRSAEFSLDADPEVCLQHMVPKALTTTLIVDAQLPVSHITQCAAELIERYAGYSSRTELRSFWRGDMTCLQKLVSSVFHSVRGFLDTDALREVGISITSCALQHFYGLRPSSLQATTGKKPTSRSGRSIAT